MLDPKKQPNEYPTWIKSKLTEAQALQVSNSVTEAEKNTSGEIVMVIARKSSAVGHTSYSLFFALLCLFLIIDLVLFNGWSFNFQIGSGIVWTFLAAVLAWLLSKTNYMQKVFVPEYDETLAVWNRAELEFHRMGIKKTVGRTGILIYVSVMERKAVVLADEAIAKVCPPETWTEMVRDLMSNFKKGEWEKGLTQTSTRAGQILSEKFPVDEGGKNELSNHLRILN